MKPWPKRFLGNLAVVLVALTVGLLLSEVAVRMIRPQQLVRDVATYRAVDTIGHEMIPNLRAKVNTGEGTVDLLTDREGYRVGDAGRRDAGTRILLIGDSFMEALQVQHEQSLAGLLEQRIPRVLGRDVAVRNTGVSGYNASHYLLTTRRAMRREPFTLVIVSIFIGNDITNRRVDHYGPHAYTLAPAPVRIPRNLSSSEIKAAAIFPVTGWLTGHSHLAKLAWSGTELLRIRLGLWQGNFPSVFLTKRPPRDSAWKVTAGICADLQRSANGIPVVFVLVPNFMQMDTRHASPHARALGMNSTDFDLEQPNRLLGEAMRAEGLEVIDALPALREAHAAGKKPYGSRDPHLSPEGHEILYRLLEPSVAGHLKATNPQ